MENDDSEDLSLDDIWEEISNVENDMLKGKLTKEEDIVFFFRHIFPFIAANKSKLIWPQRNEIHNLVFGAIGPWPLLYRLMKLLSIKTGLWNNKLLLVYLKAYLEYLFERYHLATKLLINNYPKKKLVPGYYFEFTQEILFKSGQYTQAIKLAQEELSRRGHKPPNFIETKTPKKNEVQEQFRKRTRHYDVVYTGNFVDDEANPYWYLMENLREYGEDVFITNFVQRYEGLDLLQEAQNYHDIYALPTAATLYAFHIKTNEQDHESQFLLGRILFLLGRYQEANLVFPRLFNVNDFSALSHFSLGEILFRQDKFKLAEVEFLAAIEDNEHDMAQTLSRFHLGFIREIQGDFRAALTWYEPEQDGLFPDLAISHLDALRTRKD